MLQDQLAKVGLSMIEHLDLCVKEYDTHFALSVDMYPSSFQSQMVVFQQVKCTCSMLVFVMATSIRIS